MYGGKRTESRSICCKEKNEQKHISKSWLRFLLFVFHRCRPLKRRSFFYGGRKSRWERGLERRQPNAPFTHMDALTHSQVRLFFYEAFASTSQKKAGKKGAGILEKKRDYY
jgi:hypothetical protein